jgi:hypothetical protein
MMQLSINFSLTREIMPREGTDCWKVLRMLLDAYPGYVYTADFYNARLGSFRSRLSDLRDDFHWNIPDGECVRTGVYKYRLERTGE